MAIIDNWADALKSSTKDKKDTKNKSRIWYNDTNSYDQSENNV